MENEIMDKRVWAPDASSRARVSCNCLHDGVVALEVLVAPLVLGAPFPSLAWSGAEGVICDAG